MIGLGSDNNRFIQSNLQVSCKKWIKDFIKSATSNVQRCIGDSRARRGRFIQSWPELRFIPRVKNPPAIEIWDVPSWTEEEEEVLTRCGGSIAHTQHHKLPPNAKGYQSSSRIIVKVPKTVSNYQNNPLTPQITLDQVKALLPYSGEMIFGKMER